MWPGFLAAQIVREYSLLLIFLCKIFPEKLDKARGDGLIRKSTATLKNFNPRPREGGDRARLPLFVLLVQISIHAPREGGDVRPAPRPVREVLISIHAPARGATLND